MYVEPRHRGDQDKKMMKKERIIFFFLSFFVFHLKERQRVVMNILASLSQAILVLEEGKRESLFLQNAGVG